jgi:hypothetical protein
MSQNIDPDASIDLLNATLQPLVQPRKPTEQATLSLQIFYQESPNMSSTPVFFATQPPPHHQGSVRLLEHQNFCFKHRTSLLFVSYQAACADDTHIFLLYFARCKLR